MAAQVKGGTRKIAFLFTPLPLTLDAKFIDSVSADMLLLSSFSHNKTQDF